MYSRPSATGFLMHGRNGCDLDLHVSPLRFAERADAGETEREGESHGPAKGEP